LLGEFAEWAEASAAEFLVDVEGVAAVVLEPVCRGGRPAALDTDTLAVALARRARGESVTAIAAHLSIGRSTLYRALGEAP
jgi:DNA-binding phage protein